MSESTPETSFAHHGEDLEVLEFFHGRPGIFVEAGANHPVISSQTYLLELQGWRGALIEPNPALAAACRSERPSARVFECALVEPGGPTEVRMRVPLPGLGGTELAQVCMASEAGPDLGEFFSCRARVFDDVLEEAGFESIDYLSIDLEGYEVPVLRGFSWLRWRPKLLSIEDHCENLTTYRMVTSNGYRFLRRIGDNDWFVPADSTQEATFANRIKMVRKKYLSLPFRKIRRLSRSLSGRGPS